MKRIVKRWLAGVLSVIMVFSLLPVAARAEETTAFNVVEGSVNISTDGDYTIKGSTDSNTITVNAPGQEVAVELNCVTVNKSDGSACAFDIKAGNVTLTLVGDSSFTSKAYAGIHVAPEASLTIQGNGSVTATSEVYNPQSNRYCEGAGAGIGGNSCYLNSEDVNIDTGAGTVIINSGTVTARSEGNGAGIGGGLVTGEAANTRSFERIVINGGTVNASSGKHATGIGAGAGAGVLGDIRITGGEIHASGASSTSHDIGAGNTTATEGSVTITGGLIYLGYQGISLRNNDLSISIDNALIINVHEGKTAATVYGDYTLSKDLTFDSGYTLTVQEDAKLTVAEGTKLTVDQGATLENNGAVANNGTITGDGRITGGGEFTGKSVEMAYVEVTAPTFNEAVVGYEAVEPKELTIQNVGGKTVTITGVSFDGDDFSLDSDFAESTLNAGESTQYIIKPGTGLRGENTATVTVTYMHKDESTATAEVSFTVRYFTEGSGTPYDPYLIRDLAELEHFRDYVNDGNGDVEYFTLTENIDMSGKYGEDGLSWTPIGNEYCEFWGIFDGGGHTVSGVYVKSDDGYNDMFMGFFGHISSSGTVKNLNVSGDILAGDCYFVGGVAGNSSGTVENCRFSGTVEGLHYVGGIAGSGGRIENCGFSGAVKGSFFVGGIVGDADNGTVLNCYNTGSVTGENTVGGIAGSVRGGDVSNCYSTGTVTVVDHFFSPGGIAGGITDGEVTDCYYLDTSCSTAGGGIAKKEAEFNSGEVAYLLQNGQDEQVWGQDIGMDDSPVLTGEASKRVWKVEFVTDGASPYAVGYANPAGIKELPEAPAREGYSFSHWSQTDSTDGVRFDTDTEIPGDITVYAVYQATFGGESDTITRAETYGYESAITVDLDDYVEYQSGIPTAGRFEYKIDSDADSTGASISADVLTIPTGLAAGEYTITVTATEKEPQLSLMSVGSYGTGPVTLTVKVTVNKAHAAVSRAPATNNAVYNGSEQPLVETGEATGGTMQYSLKEEGPYSDAVPTGTDVGEYTVWYKVAGDENHMDTEPRFVAVTIEKADVDVTIEPVAGQYGEDITVTATVSAGSVMAAGITGSVTFTAGGTELGTSIVTDGKATLTIPGNEAEKQKALFGESGASTVTAAYSGNDNITGGSGDGTATMNKRALTYTVTAEGREYRPGDTNVTVRLTPANLLGGDSVTLTATGNVAKADAGTHESVSLTEITADGDDAKYYTVDAENTVSVSVTISKIRAEVVTSPVGVEGLTYTGKPQNLLVGEAVCSGGTMQYFVSDKGDDTQPDEAADWLENISGITATDAGTYTIWYRVAGDGNHSDVAPVSLQVTVLPFTLSFETLDASAPYTGSAVTAPVSQTEGETPAIDPANIKISYLRDGERVEPVEPGTYDVTVSISDPNFALPGGAESVRAGTLTVTHVHAWSETEWASDNNFHWRVCTGVGECPEGGVLQHVPHTFSEPVLSDGEYVYTCTVCDRAFTAPTESYSVTGKVLDSSGSVVSGVTVTLKRGSETLAATVANDGGEYLFLYVLPGTYNIVAEKDDITMTALAVVTSDQTVDDITMPAGPINSVLEVKPAQEGQPETPAVVVGGLDQEAAKQSESGSTVTVSMTVEARAEESEDNSEEVKKSIEAIKNEAIGTDLEFIEISVQKTVSAEGREDETTPIHETQGVITLLIPYDFTGKGAVTVYRYHDSATETLREGEGSDGNFRLDRENDLIYVYTSKFSTYAIGYSKPSGSGFIPAVYSVTTPASSGGTVASDRANVSPGQSVTLTVTPDFLQRLKSLTVTDRYGGAVPCTDNGDGTVTFTMPYSDVTVEAEFEHLCPSLDFSDLSDSAWYHEYTDYVIASELMRGPGDGLFDAGGTVTRAEMVTVLWNMCGDPVVNYYMTYSDVSESAWYAEAIRWAASENIADGYGDGKFGQNDLITREQMATMLYRYEKKYGDGGFTGEWMYRLPFTDLEQISDWAFEAVAWCNMEGVITGKDENIFDPKDPAKRSEMAAILTRYCDENDIK